LPRLLVRSAFGYLVRGRPEEAALFAEEALVLDPEERDAPRILAEARLAGRSGR
jgi:Tfp pilus assembly protein PilF